jgi:hypothetical protein
VLLQQLLAFFQFEAGLEVAVGGAVLFLPLAEAGLQAAMLEDELSNRALFECFVEAGPAGEEGFVGEADDGAGLGVGVGNEEALVDERVHEGLGGGVALDEILVGEGAAVRHVGVAFVFAEGNEAAEDGAEGVFGPGRWWVGGLAVLAGEDVFGVLAKGSADASAGFDAGLGVHIDAADVLVVGESEAAIGAGELGLVEAVEDVLKEREGLGVGEGFVAQGVGEGVLGGGGMWLELEGGEAGGAADDLADLVGRGREEVEAGSVAGKINEGGNYWLFVGGNRVLKAMIKIAAQGADDEDASAAGEDVDGFEECAELLGGVVEGEEFLHLIEQEDEAGFGLVELLEGLMLERGIGLAAFLREAGDLGFEGVSLLGLVSFGDGAELVFGADGDGLRMGAEFGG